MLEEHEIKYVLGLIADTLPGKLGYSDDPTVGALQAKLSIMLEAKLRIRGVGWEHNGHYHAAGDEAHEHSW